MFEDQNLKPDAKPGVTDSSKPHLPNCFRDLNYPEEIPHDTGKICCAPHVTGWLHSSQTLCIAIVCDPNYFFPLNPMVYVEKIS